METAELVSIMKEWRAFRPSDDQLRFDRDKLMALWKAGLIQHSGRGHTLSDRGWDFWYEECVN